MEETKLAETKIDKTKLANIPVVDSVSNISTVSVKRREG